MTIKTREPARGLPRFLKVMSAIHGSSRSDALTAAVGLKPTGRDSARAPDLEAAGSGSGHLCPPLGGKLDLQGQAAFSCGQ